MASSTGIQLTKATLRTELKKRLGSMSLEDRRKQSKIISEMVLNSSEYNNSRRISIYLSMAEEVATHDILADMFQTGRQCYIPRYTGNNMEMLRILSMDDYNSLPMTKWNIKQPSVNDSTREDALSTGGLDLIVMPGLGFSFDSRTGHWIRLGRGKGYYDKYLAKFQELNLNQPLTIGLAFKQQLLDSIPTNTQDKEINQVFHA